jgi:DNA-binding NtrC family response regulator
VSVLTVLCDHGEHSGLLHLLSHTDWSIHSVNGFGEALAFLRTSKVGVVVAQYRPSGELSWRDLLDETRRLPESPRLVVTDRLADEHMWAEVLNLGAHDLLAQPFVAQEVFHVITGAWRSWRAECDSRRLARANAA